MYMHIYIYTYLFTIIPQTVRFGVISSEKRWAAAAPKGGPRGWMSGSLCGSLHGSIHGSIHETVPLLFGAGKLDLLEWLVNGKEMLPT